MLSYFKKLSIIKFTNKNTSSEDFDYIHKIFIGGIGDNIDSMVQTSDYYANKETDTRNGMLCV